MKLRIRRRHKELTFKTVKGIKKLRKTSKTVMWEGGGGGVYLAPKTLVYLSDGFYCEWNRVSKQ